MKQTIQKTLALMATALFFSFFSGCNSSASYEDATTKKVTKQPDATAGSETSQESGTTTDTTSEATTRSITVVACEGHTLEEYTLLQSKDTIQKTSGSAEYEFVHDQDGEKRICALSGSIEILREEG